ncbi:MAG: hypothetical protein FWD05_00490 [Oscillospiraceae bacterium]|nr:hypothetical protein [Oscillospiraceae bacterium]
MMRLINKASRILKDKSGMSLMFVLGIMFLLLAVGASVLTAASANIGSNVRQSKYNTAIVMTDSIHGSIKHSLEMTPSSTDYLDEDFENSLAYQIAQLIYNNTNSEVPIETVELDIDIPGVDMSAVESIALEILFQDVRFAGPVDAVPETIPPTPRIPKTATVNAQMTVCTIVEIESASLRETPRFITTVATYEYRDGILSDENADGEIREMNFSDFGKWVLVSYEIIESESVEK